MYIMLIKKLSTEVSPPAGSIHFSVPWFDEEKVLDQLERYHYYIYEQPLSREKTREIIKREIESGNLEAPKGPIFDGLFGYEHNESSARAILFDNKAIKVYDDEYSVIDKNNLLEYLLTPSHIPYGMGNKPLLYEDHVETETKVFERLDEMEAALLETNEVEAWYIAQGCDLEDFEPPKNMWFKVLTVYGLYYYDEEDLEMRISTPSEIEKQLVKQWK